MQAPDARSPVATTWIGISKRKAGVWCRNPDVCSKRFLTFCNSLFIYYRLAGPGLMGGPIIGRVENLGDMLLAARDCLDGDRPSTDVIERTDPRLNSSTADRGLPSVQPCAYRADSFSPIPSDCRLVPVSGHSDFKCRTWHKRITVTARRQSAALLVASYWEGREFR